jgi:hypothetical protein
MSDFEELCWDLLHGALLLLWVPLLLHMWGVL